MADSKHINYLPTDIKQCPWGETDLSCHRCYEGKGGFRCQYFIKYNWIGEHSEKIWCSHPTVEQLELF